MKHLANYCPNRAILLILLATLPVSCDSSAGDESRPLIPLAIGNSWTFRYNNRNEVLRITDRMRINGIDYFVLDDDIYIEEQRNGIWISYNDPADGRYGFLLRFPIGPGDAYTFVDERGDSWNVSVTADDIITSSATISCLYYHISGEQIDPIISDVCLAPGIGPIRIVFEDSDAAQLVSYSLVNSN